MRIAIAAIFKNEQEYILEWIAYHRAVIGIEHFIIADNGSNDGSTQLLEALEQAKIITRIFFPRTSPHKGPQVPAYNKILSDYGSDFDYIAFIDADEFLVNESGFTLPDFIKSCEQQPGFGSLSLNWRIFGSAGHHFRQDKLVIERFYRASRPLEKGNAHVKTLAAPKCIKSMHIHHADLKRGFFSYNEKQKPALFVKNLTETHPLDGNTTSPFTMDICNSQVYVAHYAVKSRAEHFFKKANRGSAGGETARQKGEEYFISHDLNQNECLDLAKHTPQVKAEIERIKALLKINTPYYNYLRIHLDNIDQKFSGWIVGDYNGEIRLKILLDNNIEKELSLNTKRKDVVDAGLSDKELCGFSYNWKEIGQFNNSLQIWVKGGNTIVYEKNNP